ncbi:hypothetical protein ACHAQJ_000478 [Trichoderma viride]
MEENPDKDEPFCIERWRDATVRAVTSYSEKVTTGKETFQHTFLMESLVHTLDDSEQEGQTKMDKVRRLVKILERWIICGISQLQSTAQLARIDNQSPMVGLVGQLLSILRSLFDYPKEELEDIRNIIKELKNFTTMLQMSVNVLNKTLVNFEENCQIFQEHLNVIQEMGERLRANGEVLLEYDKTTLDWYEEFRDSNNRREQETEKSFNEICRQQQVLKDVSSLRLRLEQSIEKVFCRLPQMEQTMEDKFRQLRQWEDSIKDILA